MVVKKGRYVHPGGAPVSRAYAFVGSVVEYLVRILQSEPAIVEGKTFYVGDPPADIKEWVSAFSLALTGKSPRVVPRMVLRSIARFGDVIKSLGGEFPLFTARYHSMTEDYLVPMKPTFEVLGPPRFSLEEGVEETVAWLKSQGGIWRN